MQWITDPESWVAFATLLALELVLGVDNIVFISILTGRLPAAQQGRARLVGLGLAMVMRVGLLFSLSWIAGLTAPLFAVFGHEISGRDLILILGGLFLIGKATQEIYHKVEGDDEDAAGTRAATFAGVLVQVVLLDAVFSLDSVITAVGMVDNIGIMVAAVVAAVLCMMTFAASLSAFVERHPTVKMLALSFLLLIGVTLLADGWDQHIHKGYIYFAMGFSVFVQILNLNIKPVRKAARRLRAPRVQRPRDILGVALALCSVASSASA